ncbi:MAG: hypothetical protein R2912_05935 [Eubacteriales bacterium]
MPLRWEYVIYYALFILSMLTGYFDDRSRHSWGELRKGLLDLAICLAAAGVYLLFNEGTSLSLFGWTLALPKWLFLIVAAFVLWISMCQLHRRRGRAIGHRFHRVAERLRSSS